MRGPRGLHNPDEDSKWKVVPHFLRLTKQHVASFDYFVETEIKHVVAAARCSVSNKTANYF